MAAAESIRAEYKSQRDAERDSAVRLAGHWRAAEVERPPRTTPAYPRLGSRAARAPGRASSVAIYEHLTPGSNARVQRCCRGPRAACGTVAQDLRSPS